MSHLHFSKRKELQKLYDEAVEDGRSVIEYQGDELSVDYLKYVLEFFSMREDDINK
jgi:hypothetical protein